jgi:hypothetical protein
MLGIRDTIAVLLHPRPIDGLKLGTYATELAPIGTWITAMGEGSIDNDFHVAMIAVIELLVATQASYNKFAGAGASGSGYPVWQHSPCAAVAKRINHVVGEAGDCHPWGRVVGMNKAATVALLRLEARFAGVASTVRYSVLPKNVTDGTSQHREVSRPQVYC